MRKKYSDCENESRNCAECSLLNYGKDCHNNKISQLSYMRLQQGLTQGELAKKINVSLRTIQRYEWGETDIDNMPLKNAKAIAEALNIKIDDLL